MNDWAGIALTVSQNKYLAPDDDEMHAIVTVAAHDLPGGVGGQAAEAAEVIAVDCSGSMGPANKIYVARAATGKAIDALRDGARFAIVAGTETARMVYPSQQRLAVADADTKRAAKAAVHSLHANGLTSIGTWLRLANDLLRTYPGAVRHVILLTDGQNLPQFRDILDEALAECEGNFVCDGRGIGDDYLPEELQRIVSTLRGSADAIVEDTDLVDDFAEMMRIAMSKVVPDLLLRIRTMPFTRLRYVRQVYPAEIDLTPFGTRVDDRTTAFSTGSWSDREEREFHVCLTTDLAGRQVGEDLQAAAVGLAIVRPGETEAERCGTPQAIKVRLTGDVTLSGPIDPKVAHYNNQKELAQAVKDGYEAYGRRELPLAEERLAEAVRLASGLGHDKMLVRLARIVDIIGDPADGHVQINANLRPRELFSIAMASSTATRSPDQVAPVETANVPDARDRRCPSCDYLSPGAALFCGKCGHPLAEGT
jgi:Ca-activated chloride channel family protein